MVLTEKQKQAIIDEHAQWVDRQYGDNSPEKKKKLQQFFTPPAVTFEMLERYDTIENKTIFDPTCGAGNLLAACIMAGANPKLIYGNELDETVYNICVERLTALGVPKENLRCGDIFTYHEDGSFPDNEYEAAPEISAIEIQERAYNIKQNNDGPLILKLDDLCSILENVVDKFVYDEIINAIWMAPGKYKGSVLVGSRTLGELYIKQKARQ